MIYFIICCFLHCQNDDNKKVHQGSKKKEARKGQMHEFVQVDMDKGVTYSQQEAPVSSASLCFLCVT